MVVVVAVIGIGVEGALLLMRIEVVDHIFRKVIEHFMCPQMPIVCPMQMLKEATVILPAEII